MSAKRAWLGVHGGLESAQDVPVSPAVRKCLNLEPDGERLLRRTEPETVTALPAGLQAALDGRFTSLLRLRAWYPSHMPSDAADGQKTCLLTFGEVSTGTYALRLLYYAATGWQSDTLSGITDAGIAYAATSKLRFTVSTDRIIVTDANNRGAYVRIDEDGDIDSGVLGIPAPELMPEFSTEDDANRYTRSSTAQDSGLSLARGPALFAWVTVVNEDGAESNPSPCARTTALMQAYPDPDEAAGFRWYLASVRLTAWCPKNASAGLLKSLKAFRVYIAWASGIEDGTGPCEGAMVGEYPITSTTGENTLQVSIPLTSTTVAWDKALAPPSRDAADVNGRLILPGPKSRIEFPFDFGKRVPGKPVNQNGRSYSGSGGRVKLWVSEEDVSLLNLDYVLNNRNRIRFFAGDAWTPIPCVYDDGRSNDHVLDDCDFDEDSAAWTASASWTISATSSIAQVSEAGNTGTLTQSLSGVSSGEYCRVRLNGVIQGGSLSVTVQGALAETTITPTGGTGVTVNTDTGEFVADFVTQAGCGAATFVLTSSDTFTGYVDWVSCVNQKDVPGPIGNGILCWLNVPEITVTPKIFLYLAFNTGGQEHAGVNLTAWQYNRTAHTGGEYGEFLNWEDDDEWAGQQSIFTERPRSANSIVCAQLDDDSTGTTTEAANLADMLCSGYFGGPAEWLDTLTEFDSLLPDIDRTMSVNSARCNGNDDGAVIFPNGTQFGKEIPDTGAMWLRFSYNGTPGAIPDDPYNYTVMGAFDNDNNKAMYLAARRDSDGTTYWRIKCGDNEGTPDITVTPGITSGTKYAYFALLSWRRNSADTDFSLFIIDLTTGDADSGSVTIADTQSGFTSWRVGYCGEGSSSNVSFMKANGFHVIGGTFYDATSAADIARVRNIAAYGPDFPLGFIGCQVDSATNENFSWDDTESNDWKDHPAKLTWSEQQQLGINPANVKPLRHAVTRVLSAPSIDLAPELPYSELLLLFSRNALDILPITDDISQWANSPENIVNHREERGLLSEESLTETDEGASWHSEAGAELFGPSGHHLLNTAARGGITRTLVNLPLRDDLVGAFVKAKRQMWFCWTDTLDAAHSFTFDTTEIAADGEAGAYWAGLGLSAGDLFTLRGSAHNDGTYRIESLNLNKATVDRTLTTESAVTCTLLDARVLAIDLSGGRWTEFRGIDVLDSTNLSGGAETENVTLLLDRAGNVRQYPGSADTSAPTELEVVTSAFWSSYTRLDVEGEGTGTAIVTSRDKRITAGERTGTLDVLVGREQLLPRGLQGDRCTVNLRDLDVIEGVILEHQPHITRR